MLTFIVMHHFMTVNWRAIVSTSEVCHLRSSRIKRVVTDYIRN
jgi:hypothetical protein